MQRSIPCLFMRGGTSRGPFFLESDLPSEISERDAALLAIMGSPDARQIDGLGGADTLTSKVGIVRRGTSPGVDLEFLFAQVSVKEARVDTTPNCGNMLAAVVPFALETGLVPPRADTTTLRVLTRNTGTLSDIEVLTPGRQIQYAGDARIDGVPGTSAPINISFLETAGSVCGSLLPTGRIVDRFDDIEVTCIDNGMPVVIISAADLGVTGYESREALNGDLRFEKENRINSLAGGTEDELGRRRQAGCSQDVLGGQTAHGRPHFDTNFHPARLPCCGRRAWRRDGGDRRGPSGERCASLRRRASRPQ